MATTMADPSVSEAANSPIPPATDTADTPVGAPLNTPDSPEVNADNPTGKSTEKTADATPAWNIELPADSDAAAPESSPAQVSETVKSLLDNEGIQSAIEKNPALRDELTLLGTRAETADQYEAILPTVDDAKTAVADAETLRSVDALVDAADPTPDQVNQLLDLLMYQRDANGNYVRPNPSAAPLLRPTYIHMMQRNFNALLDAMEQTANYQRDDVLGEAVKQVKTAFTNIAPGQVAAGSYAAGRGQQPRAGADPQQPQSAAPSADVDKYYNGLADTITSQHTKLAESVVAQLPETVSAPTKKLIVNSVVNQIDELMADDPSYAQQYKRILAQKGLSPEAAAEIAALSGRYARKHIKAAFEGIAKDFGASLTLKEAQRTAKVAQQQARVEPRGTGNATPPVGGNFSELVAREDKARAERGQRPMDGRELIEFTAKVRSPQPKR